MIEEQIKQQFGDYTVHGDEISVNCPMCLKRMGKTDSKHHLYINISKGVWNCFRCNWKGRDLETLGLVNDIPISSGSLKQLLLKTQLTKHTIEEDARKIGIPESELDIDLISLPKYFSQDFSTMLGRAAYSYFLKRQLSLETIKKYNLGFCYKGKLAGYIVLPVYTNRKLVYYVARAMGTKIYKNASAPVGDSIFNYEKQSRKFLCEGIFDALSFGNEGVAILGKFLKKGQFQRIIENPPKQLYICLDKDALEGAIFMAKQLKQYVNSIYITLFDGYKDANSVPKGLLPQFINSAIEYTGPVDLVKVKIRAGIKTS